MTSWKLHGFRYTTLSTYTVREKGIPPTSQVLGGWRAKTGRYESKISKSRLRKSVGCAPSLPSSFASLLAAEVPRPSVGQRTPCNDTGCPTGSVGIAGFQQNLLGKQDRVQISHSTSGKGEVQKERRFFQQLGREKT